MTRAKLLVATLVLLFSLPSFAGSDKGKPKLLAVLFYADWCGSCKALDPKIVKARGKADLDNQDVLFVRLDLTDAASRHQSALLADQLGIGSYYRENAGKTGFLLLADPKSGKPLKRILKDQSDAEIASLIKGYLKS